MISQSRCHCRGSPSPAALLVRLMQRPYYPTVVVAVHAEVRHRFVDLPILREAVRLAHLAGVEIAVRPVVALDERHVDRPTNPGALQGRLYCRQGAENCGDNTLHYAALLTRLAHCGVA